MGLLAFVYGAVLHAVLLHGVSSVQGRTVHGLVFKMSLHSNRKLHASWHQKIWEPRALSSSRHI